ncbi:hypothetical protein [Streptomyces sp. NPDC048644]|uniref:hypothetical protein n=1 Tax=Streptomyces sp. NPDC048644 TaxID=3365582 RepID=UPI003712029F
MGATEPAPHGEEFVPSRLSSIRRWRTTSPRAFTMAQSCMFCDQSPPAHQRGIRASPPC